MSESAHIHPTAIVDTTAVLGNGVSVGPFTVIEARAVVGDRTVVGAHVFIGRETVIGTDNRIEWGAVVGHEPQIRSASGRNGGLKIGNGNVIREYATIHRASEPGHLTRIGDDNYLMAGAHVGHDSQIGSHLTMANCVLLGGYVTLEDHCFLGGGAAVHQFCRIGRYGMIGGNASVTKDIPPFMLVDNGGDHIGSINLIGLRRGGFSEAAIRRIKLAYKILYLSGLNTTHALDALSREAASPETEELLHFIRESKRGIVPHRRQKQGVSFAV